MPLTGGFVFLVVVPVVLLLGCNRCWPLFICVFLLLSDTMRMAFQISKSETAEDVLNGTVPLRMTDL